MKTKFNGILTLLLAFVVQLTFAQEKTISGTVVDETNMPLPGATVVIKGTTTGTSTDFDGKYSITTNTGDVLTFSYVGYAEQDATVGSETTIDIALALDNSLEVVVVTALGIKRKPKELAYATQNVKSSELNQAKATNAATALVGKVSGLQINTTSNGVNPDTRVVLRGSRSITGNNQALIVIDGFPSTRGALNQIDPNNIESTTVLKGANAAALYGSDGANGALMITTKRGNNEDRMKVELSSTTTFETISFTPKMQTKYGQGWNGGFDPVENTNWGPELDGSLQDVGNGFNGQRQYTYVAREDNIKDFFKTGVTKQNGVSVSGGNATSNIYFGASDLSANGIVEDDRFHKNTFRLNAGKTIGKFTANANIAYLTSTEDVVGNTDAIGQRGNTLYHQLLQTPINIPLGEFANTTTPDESFTNYATNPYWIIKNVRDKSNFDKFQGVVDLKYDVTDWFNVVYRIGGDFSSNRNKAYTNKYVSQVSSSATSLNFTHDVYDSDRFSRHINSDLLLNFDFNITDDITSKILLGHNVNQYDTKFYTLSTADLTFDTIHNTSGASSDLGGGEYTGRRRRIGVYASAEFGYKNYLFLSATGRNDWSSTQSLDNNSFFYPSVGLSFTPTDAFPSLKGNVFNNLKIAASHTKVGNSLPTEYSTIAQIEAAPGFPFDVPGYEYNNVVPDPNIEPEFVTTTEINLNLGFLKNRLTFDAAYYTGGADNQILTSSTSYASGTKFIRKNAGDLETEGYEFDIAGKIISNDNWKWNARASYAHTETIVESLTGDATQLPLATAGGNTATSAAVVGESFPTIVGTAYTRDPQGRIVIDPTTGNPIRSSEQKILGKATPDYILGLSTDISYKGLRLSTVFDYRTGHQFYNDTAQLLDFLGSSEQSAAGNRLPFVIPNSSYETTPGTYVANNNIATASGAQPYWDTVHSSIAENYVVDATAFKCREIALSYTFDSKMLERLPVNNVVIGLNARNVFSIYPKANKYTDPEFATSTGNGQGVGRTSGTPPTRTIGFNVNLTF